MTQALPQFWYERSPVPTPLSIAVHLGWLNGEPSADGVAIRSLRTRQPMADATQQLEYMLSHAFRQGSSAPALWARARGADTRVIGLTWTDEVQQIVTLQQSHIRTIGDLRGQRIAIPRCDADQIDMFRATTLRGVLNALSLEGLDDGDVTLVEVARDQRRLYLAEAHALLAGQVDAIYVRGSAGLEIAQMLNALVVADIGFHPDPAIRNNNGTPRPLTVSGATLREFPDIVSGFLQLVVDAGNWAASHPLETIRYIANETGSAPQLVRAAYGPQLHRKLRVDLAPESLAGLASFNDFLLARGFLDNSVDIAQWVDHRPLQELRTAPSLHSA
ncbi:ABC transporter substrate-binding protein [Pseudoduganella sp. FT26W]|uniref:ABC transporter substrate-binding protein n=1 Tax=Duganella aquatilis TaxID=2666082 RepID=A0A844DF01_9BURK|nr:ABC transporter substrate-binding protein [Duganella aquatilis]MRW87466.1 ABC transporter substrate-binding protein [Duganella aquatilis]